MTDTEAEIWAWFLIAMSVWAIFIWIKAELFDD